MTLDDQYLDSNLQASLNRLFTIQAPPKSLPRGKSASGLLSPKCGAFVCVSKNDQSHCSAIISTKLYFSVPLGAVEAVGRFGSEGGLLLPGRQRLQGEMVTHSQYVNLLPRTIGISTYIGLEQRTIERSLAPG